MRIELPEHKHLVYTARLPIRWGDMDALGHVNNAVYFRYLETVRVDWLSSIGCLLGADGQGALIVNAFCNFFLPLCYPGEVLVQMYVSDPGRSSFQTWATLARVDAPEQLCAAGGATTVWVDLQRNQSAPLPQRLRQQLQPSGAGTGSGLSDNHAP